MKLLFKAPILLLPISLVGCQLNDSVEETFYCCRHYTYLKMTNSKNEVLDELVIGNKTYLPTKEKNDTFIEFHYDGTYIQKTTLYEKSDSTTIVFETNGNYYQKGYKFFITSENNVDYYGVDRPTEIDDESNVNNVTTLKVQVVKNDDTIIPDLFIWYYDSIYHACEI